MAWPQTYSAFRRSGGPAPQGLELCQESLPKELGPHDVLVKIHAVSLNFRDAGMLHDRYPMAIEETGIPCSDCAAEIVGTGSMVEGLAIGDCVAAIADLGNLTGHDVTPVIAIGANSPGVLREYAIFEDTHLVLLPKHMSWEEVSSS